MKKLFLTILTICILSINGFSQQEAPVRTINSDILVKGKLDEQYEFILKNSDAYNNYKVVKVDWLKNYHDNVIDTINKLKTELTVNKQKLLTVENDASALKSENSLNEELLKKRDTISFLGIPVAKALYQVLMWSLIILLAIGLGYFAYNFKMSHVHTKNAIHRVEELEEEFNNYRSRALEREQLLNRKLFDEQKKNKS